jgi:hypothetical protein
VHHLLGELFRYVVPNLIGREGYQCGLSGLATVLPTSSERRWTAGGPAPRGNASTVAQSNLYPDPPAWRHQPTHPHPHDERAFAVEVGQAGEACRGGGGQAGWLKQTYQIVILSQNLIALSRDRPAAHHGSGGSVHPLAPPHRPPPRPVTRAAGAPSPSSAPGSRRAAGRSLNVVVGRRGGSPEHHAS